MKPLYLMLALAVAVGTTAQPALAQKTLARPGQAPADTTRPALAGANPLKGRRPTPVLVGRPGAAPTTGAARAAGAAPANAGQAGVVAPQAVQPAQPLAGPASASGFTAGLAVQPYTGTDESSRLEYVRQVAQMLDSTIVTMVGVFRNTSGQPVAGATGPTTLSQRERDRWARCRDVHWDLTTYQEAMQSVVTGLPANPALQHAAAGLDTALAELDATTECDNVSSMIAAPARWDRWQEQYETAARHFYHDWYTQIRSVHERDRALVVALNGVLPAGRRLAVPPGLPPNPPYAGAALR